MDPSNSGELEPPRPDSREEPPRSASARICALIATLVLLSAGSLTLPAAAAPPRAVVTSQASTAAPRITHQPSDTTINRWGTLTSATFTVAATGRTLRYSWQQRPPGKPWRTITGAKRPSYRATSHAWPHGTRFRAVIRSRTGTVASRPATLTVRKPTRTPAADAERAFGLTGVRQGVDLSAYQSAAGNRISWKALDTWAGEDGFALLRLGSGARPIRQAYTDTCTGKRRTTATTPATRDCAYRGFAAAARARGLSVGHYWFNGWIDAIDPTATNAFAGGYSPQASARRYVSWLIRHGGYTRSSTDPLVLDVEAGRSWKKKVKGKVVTATLRAWTPAEATSFLTTVRSELTRAGYQANLYVYLSAHATQRTDDEGWAWARVAGIARLWVAAWGTNNGRIPARQPAVGPWADHGGWSIWQYTSNARFAGDGVSELDGDIATADAWTVRTGA